MDIQFIKDRVVYHIYDMLKEVLHVESRPVLVFRTPQIDTFDIIVTWYIEEQAYRYIYHFPEEIYVGLLTLIDKKIVTEELIPDMKKVMTDWLKNKPQTETEGENDAD